MLFAISLGRRIPVEVWVAAETGPVRDTVLKSHERGQGESMSRFVRIGSGVILAAALLVPTGCGSDEDGQGAAQPDVTAPGAPAGVVVNDVGEVGGQTARRLDVSWQQNPEPDVAGYNVYFSTVPAQDGSYELLGNVSSSGNIFQDERPLGGTYGYKVTAIDNAQNESSLSEAATIELPAMTGGRKKTPVDPGGGD
jgi:hypothetical protein